MERLSDYDYPLPPELIAQSPLSEREASRLLVLGRSDGRVRHGRFTDCVEILEPGDLLVLNDTLVSGVRLFGRRSTGGSVEVLLLEKLSDGRYLAMAKPAKSLKVGTEVQFEGLPLAQVAEVQGEGLRILLFESCEGLDASLMELGTVPLPPYIHETLQDRTRYQTTYGLAPGSAAAPTAGLHFTPELLGLLRDRGVGIAFVTLHVGIDTFRPVLVDDLSEHRMHGERCVVPEYTADAVSGCKGRIVAVGTTTVRTLETMADAPRSVKAGHTTSTLFIRPGYEFRIIDGMFTNFHLPKTTMMLMISALAGRENVLAAYGSAVEERYRFLSFGDSMLIL